MKTIKILLICTTLLFVVQCDSTGKSSKTERDLFPIQQNGKWGFIDKTGKIVITPQFDELRPDPKSQGNYLNDIDIFADGLACVNIGGPADGRWGYIDKTGKFIINPQFQVAHEFHEGLAVVPYIAGSVKSGYIDITGKIVIEPKFDSGEAFSEGLAPVAINSSYPNTFIDKTGKVAIDKKYDEVGEFSEGLARVSINGKYGYIDKLGNIVINPQFELQHSEKRFIDGLAIEPIGGKYGYIDKTGKYLINPQFYHADEFTEGLACVGTGEYPNLKFGFIDKTGKFVISPQFSACGTRNNNGYFSDGLAPVGVGEGDNQKFGYIDTTGRMVITPQFKQARQFSGGLAYVSESQITNGNDYSHFCYIDTTGKFVWNPTK